MKDHATEAKEAVAYLTDGDTPDDHTVALTAIAHAILATIPKPVTITRQGMDAASALAVGVDGYGDGWLAAAAYLERIGRTSAGQTLRGRVLQWPGGRASLPGERPTGPARTAPDWGPAFDPESLVAKDAGRANTPFADAMRAAGPVRMADAAARRDPPGPAEIVSEAMRLEREDLARVAAALETVLAPLERESVTGIGKTINRGDTITPGGPHPNGGTWPHPGALFDVGDLVTVQPASGRPTSAGIVYRREWLTRGKSLAGWHYDVRTDLGTEHHAAGWTRMVVFGEIPEANLEPRRVDE